MRWVLLVVAVVVVLVAVDRAVARGWFDRRRPRPYRPAESSSASGMLGDLVELFQPNRVHLTAEQERQRLDIQHAGDAAPPVDLDAGTARVDGPPPVA
ncbi:hypothetical protein Cch01nite_05530 [Cellulomonas chitinilytica]|uniref:Uncharacterized protein n=1 Tax=Cellulomonas chitinilytica TaxID=398759 RepID=A0A919P2C1_9CELL|nr:DUF6191 domain-containing protein [Cellulomonas chitinilytica]GIG19829.1 hypothetical protein Cch01nite_05530 [Cellulomonas chitinilytica]